LKQDGNIDVLGQIKFSDGSSISPSNISVPQGRVLKIADHGDTNVSNSTFGAVDLSQFF
jgi:hypothetical protein